MIKTYILDFKTPFQVKYRGMSNWSEEIIDSSLIARSLVYALSLIDESLAGELASAMVGDKVRFTAIFPLLDIRDRELPLLPFPHILRIRLIEGLVSGDLKELKKAKWITITALQEISRTRYEGVVVREEESYYSLTIGGSETRYVIKNNVLCRQDEQEVIPEKIYVKVRYIRNRIDRVTGAADPFHQETILPLTKNYIVVKCSNDICGLVSKGFRILEDIGIGSKRSIGLGRFKIVEEQFGDGGVAGYFSRNINVKHEYWVSLGRYIPVEDRGIDWGDSYYSIIERVGISGGVNPYKLPRVRALDIGSSIKSLTDNMPRGFVNNRRIGFRRNILYYNPLFYGL